MEEIWNTIKDFFTNNFWGVVKFLGVFIVGLIFVKLMINLSKRILGKTKMEKIEAKIREMDQTRCFNN